MASVVQQSSTKAVVQVQPLRASTVFPDPRRTRVVVLVINPDNLPSARADAAHLSKLFNAYLHFDAIHILLNTNAANKELEEELNKTEMGHLTVCECPTVTDVCYRLTQIAQQISDSQLETDLLVEFSSHGFCSPSISGGFRNYILWSGQPLWDTNVHAALVPHLTAMTHCLVLVDACSCGEFLVLSMQTTDLVHYCAESEHPDTNEQHMGIVCVSAVSDNQSDMNNISDEGWGGGLSCALIDYHAERIDLDKPSIAGFYRYYQTRIRSSGNTSILSFNDILFLH